MQKLLFLLSCYTNPENTYLQKILAKSIVTSSKDAIVEFIKLTEPELKELDHYSEQLYNTLVTLAKLHLKHLDTSGNLIVRYNLLPKLEDENIRKMLSDYSKIEPDYNELKFITDELTQFVETLDIRVEFSDISKKLINYLTNQMKADVDEIISFIGSKYLNITTKYISSGNKVRQIVVDKDATTVEKFSELLSNRLVYSSGYESLDRILNGGFESSRVYVFAGKPGHGKSALLLNLAHNIQKKSNGKYVVYITLENDELETMQRLAKIVLFDKLELEKIDDNYAKTFLKNQSDIDSYEYVINKYLTDKIIVVYFPPRTQVNTIFSFLTSLKSEHDYCAVCVDYASLLRSSEKYGEMRFELGQIILDLKQVAKELNIPVITAVQLNTAGYDTIPTMRNLDESRQIAQNADFIGLMYDIKDQNINSFSYVFNDRHIKLGINVDKNRNGPREKLVFSFYYDYLKFLDELEVDRRASEEKQNYINHVVENEEYYDEEDLMSNITSQLGQYNNTLDRNKNVTFPNFPNNNDSNLDGIQI